MSRRPLSFLIVPLIVVAFALAVSVWSPGGNAEAASLGTGTDVDSSLKAFTKVFAAIESNFADKVTSDQAIYKGAIPGMLRTLDPHSNFFDPQEFTALREDEHGSYYGVGMRVGSRDGKTMVVMIFGDSPAYRSGLRPGDVIVSVNDKSTAGMDTTQVVDRLKGPRGTQVQIVVDREGLGKPLSFAVTRSEISRPSVQNAYWYKPGVAYLNITQFNDNTSGELEDALKQLGESNIKLLLLDLRDNPGGVLNEGVAVTGHWLRKGELVVSQHGRVSAERPYYARGSALGQNYPIVVLVNRFSASAAEIVSGALQDHDRAWILGEVTFGKGLVQTVYPLNEDTGLALTTAHYYTPSGRLIQRDYSNISFLDYYYGKRTDSKDMSDVKSTDSGRTVYGGGGITPDEKYSPPQLNRFQQDMLRHSTFFNFTAQYFGGKEAKLPKGWTPDQNIENEFHEYVLKQKVAFNESDWAGNHEWIRQQLEREMYATAFTYEESQKVALGFDPMVAKAAASAEEAKSLLDKSKKLIVRRFNRP